MRVFRLIYVSRVARRVRFADVEAIAADAATRNAERGITGMLVYSPSHFLQVLEGDEAEVTAVFSRIREDQRHSDVQTIDARIVREREFGQWAMVARHWPRGAEPDRQSLTSTSALQVVRSALSGTPE